MKSTVALLEKLRALNAKDDFAGVLRQVIEPPEKLGAIQTLHPKHRVSLTPMLEERFRYAGKWLNAAGSQTWLPLSEINFATEKKRFWKQIALRLRHWPNSIVARSERERVCLFGINEDEYEETYLIYGNSRELGVVTYVGHDERYYGDLDEYLRFLLKGR